MGYPESPRPFNFFKDLHCKLVPLLVPHFVLWSHNVHRQQPERSEISIFSSLSLARFKITADILIALILLANFLRRNRRHKVAIILFKLKSVLYPSDATGFRIPSDYCMTLNVCSCSPAVVL